MTFWRVLGVNPELQVRIRTTNQHQRYLPQEASICQGPQEDLPFPEGLQICFSCPTDPLLRTSIFNWFTGYWFGGFLGIKFSFDRMYFKRIVEQLALHIRSDISSCKENHIHYCPIIQRLPIYFFIPLLLLLSWSKGHLGCRNMSVKKEQFFSISRSQDIRNYSLPWFTFLLGNKCYRGVQGRAVNKQVETSKGCPGRKLW